jgi:DNA invertase Pin-like site-specific DNA recombinase
MSKSKSKPAAKSPARRRAYSYIRFSTPQQAEGGSLARQLRMTEEYCKRKGLILDDSLNLNDLGVSAFRGDNVKEGALAGFLEACRTGRVPPGSFLIVESLDRLSRDQIRPALQLFLALQDHGITIVTLKPEREYTPETQDPLALIEPLIIFARAHEESQMKSHRRGDGWEQGWDRARQDGRPVTKNCPAWLEVTSEGFKIKEGAADVVRRIFDLAREGLGIKRITKRLMEENVPPLGRKGRWVEASVYVILTRPAAMGTHQPKRYGGRTADQAPEPIPGYYPAIVTEQEWQEAQVALRSKDFAGEGAGRRGKDDDEANLFTRLARCALTGEKMRLAHARGRENAEGEKKHYLYLCPTGETGSTGGVRVNYHVFEEAILSRLREVTPADIAPDGQKGNGRQAAIAALSRRLLDIDDRIQRTKQRASKTEDYDAFLDLVEALHAERRQVSQELAELQQEEAGIPSANLGEMHSLIDLMRNASPEELPILRRRLKARIRQLVEDMRVLIVSRSRGWSRLIAVQLRFRGQAVRLYLMEHRPRDGECEPLSFDKVAGKGSLDLRNPEHARRLADVLSTMPI